MKHILTAAAVIGCLLLCGCEGRTDSSPVTDSTTAVTTTVSGSVPETTGTDAETETAAKKTPAQSEITSPSSESDEADTAIGGESAAVTTDQPSEPENTATAAQAVTDQPQQPTTETTASETEAEMNSDNILPDDGLNWSPLVPVNCG